ncbi:MAG: ATP synthase F1 subunit gamma [Candidatus Levybacteria bacterium]|nr:ATP synthase F1 subunit gamma [Candidatus Levybacteria bacterium]
MASLLQLKSRIKAAQNVSKTTKAMQMIAASKLKRAQQAALAGRPYVHKLETLTHAVAQSQSQEKTATTHPYMTPRFNTKKTLVLFLSPDKGLCGGLIANLLREYMRNVRAENTSYILVGKKAQATVTRLEKDVIATFDFGTTLPTFDMVYPLMKLIDEYYLSGKVDSVKILGANFTSIFTQTPKIDTILPIALEKQPEEKKETEAGYIFEPSATDLLPSLLKHYVEMVLFQHLLESFVSEQAARMISMQNATNNAKDIIEDLRLEYNKTRQAKITSEILDITGSRAQQT